MTREKFKNATGISDGGVIPHPIYGVNLGNWLVLEKWMSPELFEKTNAEDETWLNRMSDKDELSLQMKQHRDGYITKEDFQFIAEHGFHMVRIPIPYFVFGDCPPFIGCVEYLDLAFEWAKLYGLQILLDLHTVPGSQNGYDNGGITGVCKWHKNPKDVAFALDVLERLARRYGTHTSLFGIEVLNEPISLPVYLTAPSTGKAADKNEAKGSGYVPMKFLKAFYKEAYLRIRNVLPEEKAIVFHDGFRLGKWGNFFHAQGMKNVYLDTHIYIYAMELFVPIHAPWLYKLYMAVEKLRIARAQRHVPVIIGEWSLSNRYSYGMKQGNMDLTEFQEVQKKRFQEVAELELSVWNKAAGWFYWNYQLRKDMEKGMDAAWKESWDLRRCISSQWFPENFQ